MTPEEMDQLQKYVQAKYSGVPDYAIQPDAATATQPDIAPPPPPEDVFKKYNLSGYANQLKQAGQAPGVYDTIKKYLADKQAKYAGEDASSTAALDSQLAGAKETDKRRSFNNAMMAAGAAILGKDQQAQYWNNVAATNPEEAAVMGRNAQLQAAIKARRDNEAKDTGDIAQSLHTDYLGRQSADDNARTAFRGAVDLTKEQLESARKKEIEDRLAGHQDTVTAETNRHNQEDEKASMIRANADKLRAEVDYKKSVDAAEKTLREAGGLGDIPDRTVRELAANNGADRQIDDIDKLWQDKASSIGSSVKQAFTNTDANLYKIAIKPYAQSLAVLMEHGKPTDRTVARILPFLPQPDDTQAQKDIKIQSLRNINREFREATLREAERAGLDVSQQLSANGMQPFKAKAGGAPPVATDIPIREPGQPAQKQTSDTVRVKAAGRIGEIPKTQLQQFMADNKDAQVLP